MNVHVEPRIMRQVITTVLAARDEVRGRRPGR
jgi:hypothetical protein